MPTRPSDQSHHATAPAAVPAARPIVMTEPCRCGEQELLSGPPRVYCHTVASLGRPVQVEQPYTCASCGREVQTRMSYFTGRASPVTHGRENPTRQLRNERVHAYLHMPYMDGESSSVQYSAVCVTGTREVLPTQEGTIQDGTMVDRYGDPELMANFAEHYLAAHRAVMPTGRSPASVVEIMPALHLLVMSVELAMKADLLRSKGALDKIHSLEMLYKGLDASHRQYANASFESCDPNARLTSVGETPLTVPAVLAVYDKSYGGSSSVYMDTRYYAEPTTTFKQSSSLHGANLVKGNTPYPIFLPHAVESLIDTFRFFDGAARLRRMGGMVARGAKAPVRDNHGDWGLVPSSLGLVVVQVPQHAWMVGSSHDELPEFSRWKASRPPGFSTSWMYGGSVLLFYRAGVGTPDASEMSIDGIDCRIWRDQNVGMHSRDLYRLADALDAGAVSRPLRL